MSPRPKKVQAPFEPEHPTQPVAEAVAKVSHEVVVEEVVETRNGFTLFSKGEKFSVKNSRGQVIAPFTSKDEAEQLFRNMSRKF